MSHAYNYCSVPVCVHTPRQDSYTETTPGGNPLSHDCCCYPNRTKHVLVHVSDENSNILPIDSSIDVHMQEDFMRQAHITSRMFSGSNLPRVAQNVCGVPHAMQRYLAMRLL